ncbi:hypothetical protein ILUMI_21214 [Ignelater luminosus]|uniref:Uncharacterized protein n=1 Tax=Ignelater luminosus TaxID=2038154 RepID=A0A8K0G1L2_IGNLU|nr:hypothetical protein ILUMI_21214 [Ignelater luminosus]
MENEQNENEREEEEATVNLIEMEKLEQVLEKMKNRKAPGRRAVDMLLKARFDEEWIKEEQLNFDFEILKEQITFEDQTDEAEQLYSCLEEESEPIH